MIRGLPTENGASRSVSVCSVAGGRWGDGVLPVYSTVMQRDGIQTPTDQLCVCVCESVPIE